jgi:hypothetical protein
MPDPKKPVDPPEDAPGRNKPAPADATPPGGDPPPPPPPPPHEDEGPLG